jgi:hypothetical protein
MSLKNPHTLLEMQNKQVNPAQQSSGKWRTTVHVLSFLKIHFDNGKLKTHIFHAI